MQPSIHGAMHASCLVLIGPGDELAGRVDVSVVDVDWLAGEVGHSSTRGGFLV